MTILAAVIVLVTLIVMTTGRQPAVLALICALVVAGLTGIATPAELFGGLSNGGVITIAAMLVIAKGVLYTGVISRVTYRLLAGAQTTGQVLRRLIPPVGVVSALINTTPIVAMLIPATKELEQQSGIPARGVLLPIAHATTLAGLATLIGTSSNLLIAGLAAPAGVDVKMFSFVPIAVPVALVGWLVLLIAAPLMLRGRAEQTERKLDWRAEIPVAAGANAVGRTAADLGVRATPEFELVEIQRWGDVVGPDSSVRADDILVYRATESGVRMLWASPRFGHAAQALYVVSIATDESASILTLKKRRIFRWLPRGPPSGYATLQHCLEKCALSQRVPLPCSLTTRWSGCGKRSRARLRRPPRRGSRWRSCSESSSARRSTWRRSS
ncbi:SLC13 family permease [Mycolicibacterium helvum]|uniref:Citrate transporter-like domain-containing protein n=1 Tax=Mycolicibacterium helvum TaxID=1534349 RepID=A0A7I7TDT9_9MYCO|nr:SLC13 family permease [Mycolicibacterium helvum]BBY67180.1 hypothetical protein MHEL_54230 [Mycolicibacterium helvum]